MHIGSFVGLGLLKPYTINPYCNNLFVNGILGVVAVAPVNSGKNRAGAAFFAFAAIVLHAAILGAMVRVKACAAVAYTGLVANAAFAVAKVFVLAVIAAGVSYPEFAAIAQFAVADINYVKLQPYLVDVLAVLMGDSEEIEPVNSFLAFLNYNVIICVDAGILGCKNDVFNFIKGTCSNPQKSLVFLLVLL